MQETETDDQAEPTLQAFEQEQSHESTVATEGKTHSEQEEHPVQVPDVIPNIAPPQRRKRRGRGSTPGHGADSRRDMVRGWQGDLQGNKLLYLLVSMFLILSEMIKK